MILSVGEILVDVFITENTKNVFPGGAPFNVVSNVLSFDSKASFYGVVGNDEYGKFLLDFAKKKNFTNLLIETRADKDTTQALVTLKDGERNFAFIRSNGADYCFDYNSFIKIDFSSYKIIHFGSLMLSEEKGREFLKNAVIYLRKHYQNAILSFDVNYRDDIYSSEEEAIKICKEFIPLFDVIKLSNDEVETLSKTNDLFKGVGMLTNPKQFVFLTLGKDGSMLLFNNKIYSSKTKEVKPIDTTGAGDAFYSYILSKMDKEDFSTLSKEEIERILFEANCVGALATLKKGAIDVVPDKNEFLKFVNN